MPKKHSRGIKAELPLPRKKLLYFFYSAPKSRIRNEPGIKSKICRALGYRSDGHFYHDFDCLIESSLLAQEKGYFEVTDKGKERFELVSTLSKSNLIIVLTGVTLILYFFLLRFRLLTEEGIAWIGCILIAVGLLFYVISKKYEPKLPVEAEELLADLEKI